MIVDLSVQSSMPCPHRSALEHKLGQSKPKCERVSRSQNSGQNPRLSHNYTDLFNMIQMIKMLVKYTAAMQPCLNQSLIRNMAQENHFLRCTNKE